MKHLALRIAGLERKRTTRVFDGRIRVWIYVDVEVNEIPLDVAVEAEDDVVPLEIHADMQRPFSGSRSRT